MVTAPALGLRRRIASPLALWHLLSLDAPTVAALWTWFIGQVAHVPLPRGSVAAMFLAVWILYAADRLLDARVFNSTPLIEQDDLEARHHFHHRHRTGFLTGIVLGSIALVPLLLRMPVAELRLLLVETALLGAWFLLIHLMSSAHRLPKELAVGPFFAAAVFIPTVARMPSTRPSLLLPAILLSALCSVNCLYIYSWEHAVPETRLRVHTSTRLALPRLPRLTLALILLGVLAAILVPGDWPLCLAPAVSAGLLYGLAQHRRDLHRTTLRATADLALLSPILLLPFVR